MSNPRISKKATEYSDFLTTLRNEALIYPLVYFEKFNNQMWASTLVEFTFHGCRFLRHHIASFDCENSGDLSLYDILKPDVERTIKEGVLCEYDEAI